MGLANPRCWGYNSKQNNMSPAGLMGERGDKERNNKQLQCQVVKENEGGKRARSDQRWLAEVR